MNFAKIMAIVIAGIFLFGVFSVSAFEVFAKNNIKKNVAKIDIKNMDENSLKELVPKTDLETVKLMNNEIKMNRFILWSHDGANVMWGKFANGYFIAEDNAKGKSWGIYHNGYFAGFYEDGEFFYGKYKGRTWKARGIFGLDESHGKFITFPNKKSITPFRLSAKKLSE